MRCFGSCLRTISINFIFYCWSKSVLAFFVTCRSSSVVSSYIVLSDSMRWVISWLRFFLNYNSACFSYNIISMSVILKFYAESFCFRYLMSDRIKVDFYFCLSVVLIALTSARIFLSLISSSPCKMIWEKFTLVVIWFLRISRFRIDVLSKLFLRM